MIQVVAGFTTFFFCMTSFVKKITAQSSSHFRIHCRLSFFLTVRKKDNLCLLFFVQACSSWMPDFISTSISLAITLFELVAYLMERQALPQCQTWQFCICLAILDCLFSLDPIRAHIIENLKLLYFNHSIILNSLQYGTRQLKKAFTSLREVFGIPTVPKQVVSSNFMMHRFLFWIDTC